MFADGTDYLMRNKEERIYLKEFVLITDKGVVAEKQMDRDSILAKMLYGFLQFWNDQLYKINIDETADRILEVMEEEEMDDGEEVYIDAEEILRYLFSDDEDEADGEA